MKLIKYFLYAISSLWRNKLRTALSTLGIVIGIASVTIMLALGEGLKAQMLKSLSISNDIISIIPKEQQTPYTEGQEEKPKEEKVYIQVNEIFVQDTVDKINKYVGNVKSVITLARPYGSPGMKLEGIDYYFNISGVSDNYLKTKDIKILNGYGFTPKHFKESSKVVILGNDLVKYDLEGKNPIGKTLMIGGYAFEIIGILDKSNDRDLNYSVILPMPTVEASFGIKTFSKIYIYVNNILVLNQTKRDVLYLLMKLSGVSSPSDVKFMVESNDEQIKQINDIIMKVQLFLGGIAGISLLVGGIGIMNIMLVSVMERTREIGIRKAIGAKKRDILIQFLAESIVISALGCLIAFGLSFGGVYLVNKINYEGFSAILNINVIMFSSAISICMGIIFGILPAWKASRMKPIDALRFE